MTGHWIEQVDLLASQQRHGSSLWASLVIATVCPCSWGFYAAQLWHLSVIRLSHTPPPSFSDLYRGQVCRDHARLHQAAQNAATSAGRPLAPTPGVSAFVLPVTCINAVCCIGRTLALAARRISSKQTWPSEGFLLHLLAT